MSTMIAIPDRGIYLNGTLAEVLRHFAGRDTCSVPH